MVERDVEVRDDEAGIVKSFEEKPIVEGLPILSDVSQEVVAVETILYTVVVDEGMPGWEERYDGLSLVH